MSGKARKGDVASRAIVTGMFSFAVVFPETKHAAAKNEAEWTKTL